MNGSVFPHEPDFCVGLCLLDFASHDDIVLQILDPALETLWVLDFPIAVRLFHWPLSTCFIVGINRFYDHISPRAIRLRRRYLKCDFLVVIGQRYQLFLFLFVHDHFIFLFCRLSLVLCCYAGYYFEAGDVLFWRLVYVLFGIVDFWLVCYLVVFFILPLSVHA